MLLCIWFPSESGVLTLDLVESWCVPSRRRSEVSGSHNGMSYVSSTALQQKKVTRTFLDLPSLSLLGGFIAMFSPPLLHLHHVSNLRVILA